MEEILVSFFISLDRNDLNDMCSIGDLDLLILKLLPFRGFLAHFELIRQNQRPLGRNSRRNPIPQVDSSSMSW
jgi:hypothetical protein